MRASIKTMLIGALIMFGGIWTSALMGALFDSFAVHFAAFASGCASMTCGAIACAQGLNEYQKGK